MPGSDVGEAGAVDERTKARCGHSVVGRCDHQPAPDSLQRGRRRIISREHDHARRTRFGGGKARQPQQRLLERQLHAARVLCGVIEPRVAGADQIGLAKIAVRLACGFGLGNALPPVGRHGGAAGKRIRCNRQRRRSGEVSAARQRILRSDGDLACCRCREPLSAGTSWIGRERSVAGATAQQAPGQAGWPGDGRSPHADLNDGPGCHRSGRGNVECQRARKAQSKKGSRRIERDVGHADLVRGRPQRPEIKTGRRVGQGDVERAAFGMQLRSGRVQRFLHGDLRRRSDRVHARCEGG